MAGLGLTPEDFAAEAAVEIWPDNWHAVQTFELMQTQWRMGPSGPSGLDYGVLPTVLRFSGVPRGEWPTFLDDLRVMEAAALAEIHSES